jgi:hypothetical protein
MAVAAVLAIPGWGLSFRVQSSFVRIGEIGRPYAEIRLGLAIHEKALNHMKGCAFSGFSHK